MRYVALAADYDGTLASQGVVAATTVDALRRLARSGRKLILVTGRELDELLAIFPDMGVFDRVVAENGGLLYCPATQTEKVLGLPPPPEFAAELVRRGVEALSVGRCIVATVTPHEGAVLDTIRDLGLELQVIFNKGAVMILPAGVNKASGLAAALSDLHLSPRNVAAIGDAENDHALLRSAEFGAAVANALPMLKRDADRVSPHTHGEAVVELIEAMLADDLKTYAPVSPRRVLVLGQRRDGEPIRLPTCGADLFITGPSGTGKSVLVAELLERLAGAGYQYCVFDSEGDYASLARTIALGGPDRVPTVDELSTALDENADACLVINLAALGTGQRPALFKEMLARVRELRATIGRPHWVVVGEAHRMYDAGDADPLLRPQDGASSMIYVSVHPQKVVPAVLDSVSWVAALGSDPAATLAQYAQAMGAQPPAMSERPREHIEALAWRTGGAEPPLIFKLATGERAKQAPRKRAVPAADLPPERSFYYRGPEGRLNLRAQNLALLLQIGRGVDDETWLHHLREQDYSRWLRSALGDERLAARIQAIETQGGNAELTRERVAAAIESYLAA